MMTMIGTNEEHTVSRRTVPRIPQACLLKKQSILWLFALILLLTAGCSGGSSPTRTPVPTWTPTPVDGGEGAEAAQPAQDAVQSESSLGIAAAPATEAQPVGEAAVPAEPVPQAAQPEEAAPEAPASDAVEEPTATPIPAPTEAPTEVPTEVPTETPTPTGPQYDFELEVAEKFPTDSLAENVVRVFLYVYSNDEFALPGYSLVVAHNESSLPVDAISTAGLPSVTRDEPGIYTRFTNMNAIFIEPPGGTWAIQLVDELGVAVGPPAFLELEPDDTARELYLRYRLK